MAPRLSYESKILLLISDLLMHAYVRAGRDRNMFHLRPHESVSSDLFRTTGTRSRAVEEGGGGLFMMGVSKMGYFFLFLLIFDSKQCQ